MVGRVLPLALAGIGLAFGPAALADTASTGGAAPATEAPVAKKKTVNPDFDDNAVVCRREDTTGTRLGATKVCHTRAEWNAISAAARETVDRWHAQANATMPH